MDKLIELLRGDMIERGIALKEKEKSAEDISDQYAKERGEYGEIKMALCEKIAEAIARHHNHLEKIGGGVSALNTDIYDIDGETVLYQTRIYIKAEGQKYAKTKIRYFLARIERGEIAEFRALDIKGQSIHYFIRNGKSPIAALRAEGKL